ncbi:hypothetical protein K439DRAFT_1635842 [Ramaria rubella]|nr:hypothetical protein K439DRAFT_1635842 [Ramaria rubella]
MHSFSQYQRFVAFVCLCVAVESISVPISEFARIPLKGNAGFKEEPIPAPTRSAQATGHVDDLLAPLAFPAPRALPIGLLAIPTALPLPINLPNIDSRAISAHLAHSALPVFSAPPASAAPLDFAALPLSLARRIVPIPPSSPGFPTLPTPPTRPGGPAIPGPPLLRAGAIMNGRME